MVKTINLRNQIQRLSKLNTSDLSLVLCCAVYPISGSNILNCSTFWQTFKTYIPPQISLCAGICEILPPRICNQQFCMITLYVAVASSTMMINCISALWWPRLVFEYWNYWITVRLPTITILKDLFRLYIIQYIHCQNPNSTPTQPQPNITLVGLDTKMTLHTPTPPPQNFNF